jgi:hypothetical protein
MFIEVYNGQRPHASLGGITLNMVYTGPGGAQVLTEGSTLHRQCRTVQKSVDKTTTNAHNVNAYIAFAGYVSAVKQFMTMERK